MNFYDYVKNNDFIYDFTMIFFIDLNAFIISYS